MSCEDGYQIFARQTNFRKQKKKKKIFVIVS